MEVTHHLILSAIAALACNFALNKYRESKSNRSNIPYTSPSKGQQIAQIGVLMVLFVVIVHFANGFIVDKKTNVVIGGSGAAAGATPPPSYSSIVPPQKPTVSPVSGEVFYKQPVPAPSIARLAYEDLSTGMPDF